MSEALMSETWMRNLNEDEKRIYMRNQGKC